MERLLFYCLLLGLPGLAVGEIYRWTDASGQVHFSEQPAFGAERIEVKPQVVESDAATRESQQHLQRLFDARHQEQRAAQQKKAALRAERASECSQLHNMLAGLSQPGRLFSESADGERTYYSDKQVKAARSEVASQLSRRCQ